MRKGVTEKKRQKQRFKDKLIQFEIMFLHVKYQLELFFFTFLFKLSPHLILAAIGMTNHIKGIDCNPLYPFATAIHKPV